jgi:hypothetical protein
LGRPTIPHLNPIVLSDLSRDAAASELIPVVIRGLDPRIHFP